MCAYRELLLKEYREIVRKGESYKGGYEPGTRDGRSDRWSSEEPNLDIRHDKNLTKNRWSPDQFRDKSTCANWQEGNIKDLWIQKI